MADADADRCMPSPANSHTLGAGRAHNPTRRWTETQAPAISPWQVAREELCTIFRLQLPWG